MLRHVLQAIVTKGVDVFRQVIPSRSKHADDLEPLAHGGGLGGTLAVGIIDGVGGIVGVCGIVGVFGIV